MAVKPVLLRLMPPADNSPNEPRCYSSPAKFAAKRECIKVQRVSSFQQLLDRAAQQEQEEAMRKDEATEEEGEEEMDHATVHTYKKSQYWSKEVEDKLGLGGADPYGLLELEDKRWRATADEIRKAYRRLVLTMHPDKKASAAAVDDDNGGAKGKVAVTEGGEAEEGAGEEEEDAEFKLLGASWELLGNAESRRAYDSIDNFNDYLPTTFGKRSGRTFFQVFGPPFLRQSKFSTVARVPQLGDESTPYETVAQFYKFWFSFSSWRDFSLLAEHDYKEAEDREERRWMQRQNKNFTDRIKKDERLRVQAFVQLAYDSDPRIAAYKEKVAAEKAAAKEAKEAALRAEREKKEAATKQKENEAAAASAAAEAGKQAEAEERAASKREKEKQRSALKKARKELKALGEGGPWASRASDLDVVAAVLTLPELTELTSALAAGESEEACEALGAALKSAMAR